MIPSSSNSVAKNVETILLGATVGTSLQATANDRKRAGGPLAGVPVDDPLYVPMTIGNLTILHYLWPFMFGPFLVLMAVGVVPFWGLAIVIHNASPGAGSLSLFVLLPTYFYLVVWRVGVRGYWHWVFCKLF